MIAINANGAFESSAANSTKMAVNPSPKVFALIVAAGLGSRFGGALPKQYAKISANGRTQTVLQWSVEALARANVADGDAFMHAPLPSRLPVIDHITLVVAKADERAATLDFALPVYTVAGGDARWQSVAAGVAAIAKLAGADDLILIHDAARPCLAANDLRAVLAAAVKARQTGQYGAMLAAPVSDTLRKKKADGTLQTLDRTDVWAVQTPQIFTAKSLVHVLDTLHNHHNRHKTADTPPVTDEAMGYELLGLSLEIVPGCTQNIKITYAADLALAAAILCAAGV